MEMQQEFHFVNMDGSASGELQLPSSASSSPPSSAPDSPSSASSNSPIHSPPLLRPQLSYRILVPPAAALDSTARPHMGTREQALRSLKESIPHTKMLQQLQKEERAHRKDASWHKKAARRLSKELYLVVSMYAVLQGALFTAVAQSTVFTCSDLWGPAGIIAAVTVGTISGTLDKLRRMGYQKQEVRKFERRQSAVYDKIAQLYETGSACSLEDSSEPAHNAAFDSEPGRGCIFSVHGMLVLFFLAGFSFLITVSCIMMLCRSCHCNS